MIFEFLKYLQPTNYFSLKNSTGETVFPDVNQLPSEIVNQLNRDKRFRSNIASEFDMSWQAIQKGYIGNTKTIKTIKQHQNDDFF